MKVLDLEPLGTSVFDYVITIDIITDYIFLSHYAAIHPHGHSRQAYIPVFSQNEPTSTGGPQLTYDPKNGALYSCHPCK